MPSGQFCPTPIPIKIPITPHFTWPPWLHCPFQQLRHSCLKPWFLGLIPTPRSVIKRHPISTHRFWLIFILLPNAGETPRAVNYRLLSLSYWNLPCCDTAVRAFSSSALLSHRPYRDWRDLPSKPCPFPFRGLLVTEGPGFGFTRLRLGRGRNGGNVLFSWSQISNTFNDPAKEMKTNQLSPWYQNKALSRES